MRTTALILLAALGCATKMVWSPVVPGKTQVDFGQDKAFCMQQAMGTVPPVAQPGVVIQPNCPQGDSSCHFARGQQQGAVYGAQIRRNRHMATLFNACMTGRGWELVPEGEHG